MKKRKFVRILQYTIISIQLLVLSGCQESLQKSEPAVLAVWESPAGNSHWKFTLLEDGTLSEVMRPDGQNMVLSEGGLSYENSNIILRYIFGPCVWSYDKETNRLKITIEISDFYIKAEDSELNCTWIDELEGSVSSDGNRWTAKWTTRLKYNTLVPDRVEPARNLVLKKVLE